MAEKVPVRPGLFREGPDGGRLLGNKCKSCDQIYFPKAHLCLDCGYEELEEVELSQKGTLYSYTIGHMPSFHFQPPYTVGYVVLPEEVRVFAPLCTIEDKPLEVGMDMELVIEKLWEEGEEEVIGYRFRPV